VEDLSDRGQAKQTILHVQAVETRGDLKYWNGQWDQGPFVIVSPGLYVWVCISHPAALSLLRHVGRPAHAMQDNKQQQRETNVRPISIWRRGRLIVGPVCAAFGRLLERISAERNVIHASKMMCPRSGDRGQCHFVAGGSWHAPKHQFLLLKSVWATLWTNDDSTKCTQFGTLNRSKVVSGMYFV
jgi:hypothetical protein